MKLKLTRYLGIYPNVGKAMSGYLISYSANYKD